MVQQSVNAYLIVNNMKKLVLFILFIIFVTTLSAQDKQNIKVVANAEPAYPKSDKALFTYVYMNLKYTDESIKKYIQGEVTISFDVKADSTVTNAMIISGVGYGVDEEVKKLIQTLKFSPGMQNGMAVTMNTMYTFSVKAH